MILNEKEEIEKVINSHEIFVFDCDGVLWSGSVLYDNVKNTLKLLSEKYSSESIYFYSNATHRTREEFFLKMKEVFEPEIKLSSDLEHYICPNIGVVMFLKSHFKEKLKDLKKENIFLISNNNGFPDEFKQHNIPFYRMTEKEIYCGHDEYVVQYYPLVKDCKVVVVGYDRQFTTLKLTHACTCLLQKKDCLFLVSDDDVLFPWHVKTENVQVQMPGTGTYYAAIKHATGRKDDILIGKPSNFMLERIIKLKGWEGKRERILYFGDSMHTDIPCCCKSKIHSVLVLTGNTKIEDIKEYDYKPNYVMSGLGRVYDNLKK